MWFLMSLGVSSCLFVGMNIFVASSVFFLLAPLVCLLFVGDISYEISMESFVGAPLVVLCLWIGGLSLLIGSHVGHARQEYLVTVGCLIFFLVLGFGVSNGVLFYLAFEASLVPISFLVVKWGHSPERLEAVVYLVLYTVLGGSLHMVSLVMMDLFFGSTSFNTVVSGSSDVGYGIVGLWWFGVIVPFLVKAPCYGFHLWLPKAHVEAPASGSMILAAVMLKLGIYGFIQYGCVFLPPMWIVVGFQVVGILGGFLSSLVALRQVDLKGLIAYASVGHMSFSVAGILTYSTTGSQGVMFMMISHGLASSGLFAWAGVLYEKLHTRNLLLMSGLRVFSPTQSFVLVVFLMANSGLPPFVAFFGELFVFSSLVLMGWGVVIVLIASMVVEMLYSIMLVIMSQHSGLSGSCVGLSSVSDREWLVFWGHGVPLLLLFVWPGVLLAF